MMVNSIYFETSNLNGTVVKEDKKMLYSILKLKK